MALKVDYLLRETGHNLRRNLTLTLASVVTVAVSLALVGSALVVRYAVNHSTARWKGNIQFIVFMKPDASQSQINAIGQNLHENKQVAGLRFVNHDQAYKEYRDEFRNDPVTSNLVSPADLPTSWRVSPKIKDPKLISQLGQSFQDRPGVYTVVFPYDAVRAVQNASNLISNVLFITAVCLLVAATLLILNTIRMAMFARRREVEVMKLVGATNWFIRVPFMLEGLIQGLVGSLPAVAAVWGLHWWLDNHQTAATATASPNIFESMIVSGGQAWLITISLLVIGAGVGVVGSAVAVSRFLDV